MGQTDPLLSFKLGLMSWREPRESGLRLKAYVAHITGRSRAETSRLHAADRFTPASETRR